MEQSPAAVVITDRDGHIEYVNPKFTEVTGYAADEVIGETPRLFKSEETPPGKHAELWNTITSGETVRAIFPWKATRKRVVS